MVNRSIWLVGSLVAAAGAPAWAGGFGIRFSYHDGAEYAGRVYTRSYAYCGAIPSVSWEAYAPLVVYEPCAPVVAYDACAPVYVERYYSPPVVVYRTAPARHYYHRTERYIRREVRRVPAASARVTAGYSYGRCGSPAVRYRRGFDRAVYYRGPYRTYGASFSYRGR